MSIVRVQLRHEASANEVEDTFYLSRDTARNRLFIEHEWVRRQHGDYEAGVDELEIEDFLMGSGEAQRRLRALLGMHRATARATARDHVTA